MRHRQPLGQPQQDKGWVGLKELGWIEPVESIELVGLGWIGLVWLVKLVGLGCLCWGFLLVFVSFFLCLFCWGWGCVVAAPRVCFVPLLFFCCLLCACRRRAGRVGNVVVVCP